MIKKYQTGGIQIPVLPQTQQVQFAPLDFTAIANIGRTKMAVDQFNMQKAQYEKQDALNDLDISMKLSENIMGFDVLPGQDAEAVRELTAPVAKLLGEGKNEEAVKAYTSIIPQLMPYLHKRKQHQLDRQRAMDMLKILPDDQWYNITNLPDVLAGKAYPILNNNPSNQRVVYKKGSRNRIVEGIMMPDNQGNYSYWDTERLKERYGDDAEYVVDPDGNTLVKVKGNQKRNRNRLVEDGWVPPTTEDLDNVPNAHYDYDQHYVYIPIGTEHTVQPEERNIDTGGGTAIQDPGDSTTTGTATGDYLSGVNQTKKAPVSKKAKQASQKINQLEQEKTALAQDQDEFSDNTWQIQQIDKQIEVEKAKIAHEEGMAKDKKRQDIEAAKERRKGLPSADIKDNTPGKTQILTGGATKVAVVQSKINPDKYKVFEPTFVTGGLDALPKKGTIKVVSGKDNLAIELEQRGYNLSLPQEIVEDVDVPVEDSEPLGGPVEEPETITDPNVPIEDQQPIGGYVPTTRGTIFIPQIRRDVLTPNTGVIPINSKLSIVRPDAPTTRRREIDAPEEIGGMGIETFDTTRTDIGSPELPLPSDVIQDSPISMEDSAVVDENANEIQSPGRAEFEAFKQFEASISTGDPNDRPIQGPGRAEFESQQEIINASNGTDNRPMLGPGRKEFESQEAFVFSVQSAVGDTIGEKMIDTIAQKEGVSTHIGVDSSNVTLPYGIVPDGGLQIDGEPVTAKHFEKNGGRIPDSRIIEIDYSNAFKNVGNKTFYRKNYSSDQEWATAILNEVESVIEKDYPKYNTLSDSSKIAIVDFAYNAGTGIIGSNAFKEIAGELEKPISERNIKNITTLFKWIHYAPDNGDTYTDSEGNIKKHLEPSRGILKRRAQMYNLIAPKNKRIHRIEQKGGANGKTPTYILYDINGNVLHKLKANYPFRVDYKNSPNGFLDVPQE